jgi:hypothetical protein
VVDAIGSGEGWWRYVFNDCTFAFARAGAGRTCGDNGGVCANGKPCRQALKCNSDGRCQRHPYKKVVVALNGPDGMIRPFPSDIPWADVTIAADGETIEAVVAPCDYLESFYSATHVYNDVLCKEFRVLGLEEPCCATCNGQTIRLNPLQTSTELIAMGYTKLNGRKLVAGFNLADYHVLENRDSVLT